MDLVFDGTFTPEGLAPPWRRRVGLEASATSPARIELRTTAGVLSRLTDEPVVFRGSIEATFPTAPGAQLGVSTRSSAEVTLELRPGGSTVPMAARRSRDAERYLEALGISLSGEGPRSELVVGAVAPGSPAARAGVAPLDRLLGVDGRNLADLSELGGIDPDEAHSFDTVTGAGEVRQMRLRLAPRLSLENDEMFALVLAAAILGAFFVLAAPRRRTKDPGAAHWTLLAVPLLASVPVALLPQLFELDVSRPGLLVALVAAAAVALSCYELTAPDRLAVRLGRTTIHLVALSVSVLVALLWSNSPVHALVLTGGGHSSQVVAAWTSPAHLALLLLSLSLIYPSSRSNGGELERAMQDVAAVPAAAVMALLWLCPTWLDRPQDLGSNENGQNALLLALGSAVLLVISRQLTPWITDQRRRDQRTWSTLTRFSGLVLAAGMAVTYNLMELPLEVQSVLEVLTTALFFAVCVAALLHAVISGRVDPQSFRARRERTNAAMDGGTNPLISPP